MIAIVGRRCFACRVISRHRESETHPVRAQVTEAGRAGLTRARRSGCTACALRGGRVSPGRGVRIVCSYGADRPNEVEAIAAPAMITSARRDVLRMDVRRQRAVAAYQKVWRRRHGRRGILVGTPCTGGSSSQLVAESSGSWRASRERRPSRQHVDDLTVIVLGARGDALEGVDAAQHDVDLGLHLIVGRPDLVDCLVNGR